MPVLGRSLPNQAIVIRGSLEDSADFDSRSQTVVVTSQPDRSYGRGSVYILVSAVQAQRVLRTVPPVVVTVPLSSYFNPTVTTILRNTLQDPPVLTTPQPLVVVDGRGLNSWFGVNTPIVIVPQAPVAAAPAATTPQPVVINQPYAQQWFNTNPVQVSTAPLPPQPPAQPLVQAPPTPSQWFSSNTPQVVRRTLQDPPVLTTPLPVVETSQPASAYYKTQGPQVLAPPAQPVVAPTAATPSPIVVAAAADLRWFAVEPPQNFRNTTQDPPVLTTARPLVLASPTPQAFLNPQLPTIISSPQAPVVTPTLTPQPVVVSSSMSAHFQVRQAIIVLGRGVVVRPTLHLGGTVTETNLLGGTVVKTSIVLAGTVVDGNVLGGTVVDGNALVGTVTNTKAFGGTAIVIDVADTSLDRWTMIEVDITLAEFNDETLALTITSGGNPYNITGLTLEMYLKQSAGELDTDPNVVKLSTVTGEITITNGAGGLASVAIASANLAASKTYGWYRVDIINAGKRNTALFGKVGVTQL